MPVETPSIFAQVIREHLDLKERNARLEQLYPFPVEQARALVTGYPNLRELVWVQEEPQNMGAWRAIRHRLEETKPEHVPLLYVGRPWRASPSEGYPTAHLREQDRIVRSALGA